MYFIGSLKDHNENTTKTFFGIWWSFKIILGCSELKINVLWNFTCCVYKSEFVLLSEKKGLRLSFETKKLNYPPNNDDSTWLLIGFTTKNVQHFFQTVNELREYGNLKEFTKSLTSSLIKASIKQTVSETKSKKL